MNCGEDGCPCCPEESPAVAALRRWVALLQPAPRPRAPTQTYLELQRGLGLAGYVPKRDEDDS